MSVPQPNAFEEERRLRIERNQAVLQGLGLLDNPLSAAAERKRSAAAADRARQRQAAAGGEAEAPQPTRRSRRLQGEKMDASVLSLSTLPPEPDVSSSRPARGTGGGGGGGRALREADQDELDRHNLMRIRSMSEKALRTRIWKIQRVDKMRSFVALLDACGMAELAAEARQALRELCGGGSDGDGEQQQEGGG